MSLGKLVEQESGQVFPLGFEVVTIGRHEDNIVVLPDPNVSRHHAEIRREGTSFLVTDLESANGTLVNGVRLTAPHALRHGERITIGDTELVYQEPGQALRDTMPLGAGAAQRVAPAPSGIGQARGPRTMSPGVMTALVVAGALLLLALLAVAVYVVAPGFYERIGLVSPASPTAASQAATEVATLPPAETPGDIPAPTAGAATLEPGGEAQEMGDLLTQAEALARRSKFEEAEAIYQELVSRAPEDARPEAGWAWALILDDRAQEQHNCRTDRRNDTLIVVEGIFDALAVIQAGFANVETLELDGERHHTLPAGTFDAAISRVGLIYFPDQQRALAGIRRALKPGGRFAAVVYSTPDKNAFFSLPVGIIRRRAQLPEAGQERQPAVRDGVDAQRQHEADPSQPGPGPGAPLPPQRQRQARQDQRENPDVAHLHPRPGAPMELRPAAEKAGDEPTDPLCGREGIACGLGVIPASARGVAGQLKRRQKDGGGEEEGNKKTGR